MKKIIFLLALTIFYLQPNVKAEEISLSPNNETTLEDVKQSPEEINLEPIILEPEEKPQEEKVSPYTKKALKGIIERNYDLNSTRGMLHDQLRVDIPKGPVKDANLQVNLLGTFSDTIDSKNSNFKFRMQTINVGLNGKFRSEKEGYNLLFDLTPTNQNFFHHLVLDAWVETKRIPHNTLMFGTSRPTVGYEGGQSPYLIPFLTRSQTARNFGNIRKTGIRLKGDYKYMDYDLGGYSSDTWYSEFFPGVEADLWVNFKPLAKGEGKWGNLNVGGGIQTGSRNSTDFLLEMAALRYEYKKFWMRAEWANADGSNGASGLTEKRRWGYNFTLAYRLTKKLEFLLRYDDFDPDKMKPKNNQREYTAGINYFILGQTARLILNYVLCQNTQNSTYSHKIMVGTQFLL